MFLLHKKIHPYIIRKFFQKKNFSLTTILFVEEQIAERVLSTPIITNLPQFLEMKIQQNLFFYIQQFFIILFE
jgi:hypothetical protein